MKVDVGFFPHGLGRENPPTIDTYGLMVLKSSEPPAITGFAKMSLLKGGFKDHPKRG